MTSMSWTDVVARRVERHGLAEPSRDASPADVVAAMCGAHAQVLSAAELSVGLRIAGSTREDVRHALWTDRSLVKTFGPRGTVHLLPKRDLPMWTAALSVVPSPSPFSEDMRMTAEQTDQVVAAIAAALDNAELTIDELSDAVIAGTGPWAGDLVMPAFQGMWPRWRQAIGVAAHRGVLCFGANRGRKVTYTSPDRFETVDTQDALRDLVRRYLHAYGPATPQQFARWLAAPASWATALFKSIENQLEPVELDGSIAWLVAGDTAVPSQISSGVRLLPYFDAYAVGSHPRDLVFPGRATERALSRGQAGNFPVMLLDGVVAGVWHQRRASRRLHVTVEPFGRLTAAQKRQLADQVTRVGEIQQADPELTVGPVTVGAHA
jgi:hypothetical protein